MKRVHINFYPGAGGNFLARALGLNDEVYAFPKAKNSYATDVSEKFALYSYNEFARNRTIHNFYECEYNWTAFEQRLFYLKSHHDVPSWATDNSYFVTGGHPQISSYNKITKLNLNFLILITDDHPRWKKLNALYKNSKMYPAYLNGYKLFDSLPEIIHINQDSFFNPDAFWEMFTDLCEKIEIDSSRIQEQAIKQLYSEWYDSSLMTDQQLDEFEIEHEKHLKWLYD